MSPLIGYYSCNALRALGYLQGLDDLRNGIIRTPLPPLQTFRDDPLRVIRCIRFASRFGFAMTPELQDTARDQSIQVISEFFWSCSPC